MITMALNKSSKRFKGKEDLIAKVIHEIGFPNQVRKKLGDSYGAVLDAYINKASMDEDSGISNAVFAAYKTRNKKLISDLGERVLKEDPSTAYLAGRKGNNINLRKMAEEALLQKGNPIEAYNAAEDYEKGFDPEFLARIIDMAIEKKPDDAFRILNWHMKKDRDVTKTLVLRIAKEFLSINPENSYFASKISENEYLLTKSRKAWAKKNPLEAFRYGENGGTDIDLAKLAIENSTKGITGRNLYGFIIDNFPNREDLMQKARVQYVKEDPRGAYLTGKFNDKKKDEKLINLALSNPKFPIYEFICDFKAPKDKILFKRAALDLSKKTGLSSEDIQELYK